MRTACPGAWTESTPRPCLSGRGNVAMGGTLGGEIDPNFTQDVMEVDYIRLYQ